MLALKKGFYFSLEALFAVILLLGVTLLLSRTYVFSVSRGTDDTTTMDIMKILSEIKVNQIENDYVISLIKNETILDYDISVLELIGKLWIEEKKDLSQKITQEILLNYLNYNDNVEISIQDNNSFVTIFKTQNITNNSRVIQNSRMISGIEMRKPIEGFTSKSILKNIKGKTAFEFAFFGGFVGQGNITRYMKITGFDDIKKIYFEGDIKNSFELFINKQKCNTSEYTQGYFFGVVENETVSSFDFTDCKNFIVEGNNNITLVFDNSDVNNSYVGGGFLQVDYTISEMSFYEKDTKTYLPEISGIINLFTGVNFENDLEELNIYLKHKNNYSIFFNLGNKTIYESNSTNNTYQEILINDSYLSSILNYSKFNSKTIPLRIGTKNFTNRGNIKKYGNGDAVLVTDVSGSMNWDFVSSNTGVLRYCDDTQIYDDSSRRISVAKCINNDFVDSMLLGIEGNRVGLTSYESSLSSYLELGNNITSIKNEINDYIANGGTCIACGIKKAQELLKESEILFSTGTNFYYNYSDFELVDTNGNYWYEDTFDYSGFYSGNTPMGQGYSDINTSVTGAFDKYFFKKSFTIDNSTIVIPQLYLAVDDKATVYINDKLIYNDSISHSRNYWNVIDDIAFIFYKDDFENGLSDWVMDSNNDGGYVGITNEYYSPNNAVEFYGDGYAQNNIWIQQEFDLSSLTEPFIEMYVSYEDTESTDRFFIDIFDGEWHTIYSDYEDNNKFWFYHSTRDDFSKIKVSIADYDLSSPVIIRLRSEVVHDPRWDSIVVDDFAIRDYDVLKEGTNIVSAMVESVDLDMFFDMQISKIDTSREKAMVVMSDGDANYCYSESGTWNCNDNYAKEQAIEFACEAHQKYGIKIYAVAFSQEAEENTLMQIAACDNSSNYFKSNNVTGLMEIYDYISQEMLKEMTIAQTQNFDIIGNFSNSFLSGESYIESKYNTSENIDSYGKIKLDFVQKINKTNPVINIPSNLEIVDAKVTSYSDKYWTSEVIFNGAVIYNISEFNSNYTNLGDPFIINIRTDLIQDSNEIIIKSRDISGNTTFISNNNSFIYTGLLDISTSYTNALEKNEGCSWEVETELGNVLNFSVPKTYSGIKNCSYTSANIIYDADDSIDTAVYGLLKGLDLNSNGKIIVDFTQDDLEIYFMSVSKVPYMWGPTIVKVKTWD